MLNEGFRSSHVIQGPKGWKGEYENVRARDNYYADGLAKRLATLGFKGYISCDECEVYLTHETMKSALTYPYKISFSSDGIDTSKETKRLINAIINHCAGGRKPLRVTETGERGEEKTIEFVELESL